MSSVTENSVWADPFELDDIDIDNIDGYDVVAPGRYHVEASSVDPGGGKNGEMIVDYEVLSGTTPNQEGKTHRDYYSASPAARKRVLMFALATKIVTVEELKAAREANRRPKIEWRDAVGRQLCVEINEEEYEGKKRSKVGFGIYAVDSPRAAGIPLNKGRLEKAGDAADDPFGGGNEDIFGG